MLADLLQFLKDYPKELVVLITAMLPVLELRGSIPVGLAMGMPMLRVMWISILGNLIPVIPLLFLFQPVSNWLRRFKIFQTFFEWLDKKTRRNAKIVEQYEAFGLMLFVAIPLPGTGAWTGCFAATLFKIKFRYALLAVAAGVILAGVIVSVVCIKGSAFLYQLFTA